MTQTLILIVLALAVTGYFFWLWNRFWPGETLPVGREYWLSRRQLAHGRMWLKGRRYNVLYDFPWFYALFLGNSVIWSEPGEGPGAVRRLFVTLVFLGLVFIGVELTRRRHNQTAAVHRSKSRSQGTV